MKKIIIDGEYEWLNREKGEYETVKLEIVQAVPEQPDGEYGNFGSYDNYVSYVLGDKLQAFTQSSDCAVVVELDGEYRVVRIHDFVRVTARIEETLDELPKPKLIVAK